MTLTLRKTHLMNNQRESAAHEKICTSLLVRGGLALFIFLAWLTVAASGQSQPESSATTSPIHVTHVLGLEGVHRNVSGELSIHNEGLSFEQNGSPAAQVSMASIRNISLGEQDRQVGGVPLMLGKAAVPFAGGRAVSLFSHKKYDSLAIDYLDSTGGFHGVIFRLPKGQGDTFRNALIARGAHTGESEPAVAVKTAPEPPSQLQKWSVQVDRIDPGATALDACFSDAIYENLLQELTKSKQFNQVFRSGDRNADDAFGVLVLKMVVQKYSPGSETRRAVTTVSGATKLTVDVQLVTRSGRVVLEQPVAGNVRFLGDNLKATKKVASSTAKLLRRSALPVSASLMPQEKTSKEAAGGL